MPAQELADAYSDRMDPFMEWQGFVSDAAPSRSLCAVSLTATRNAGSGRTSTGRYYRQPSTLRTQPASITMCPSSSVRRSFWMPEPKDFRFRWFCLKAWTGCNSNEGSGTYTTRHWGRVRGFTHPHPLPDHPAAGPDPECYGGRRLELAALYPGLTHDDPRAIQDLSGDQSFGHKARWFAIHSRTPAWLYSFQRQPPGKRHTTGAPHGGEVAFVHGFDEDSRQCMSLAGPHCPEDFALADTMHEFWTVFAQTGDPNRHGADGVPHWPVYEHGGSARMMALDHVCCDTPVLSAPKFDLLDVWLQAAVVDELRPTGGAKL